MKLFKLLAAVLIAALTMGMAVSTASADPGDVITVGGGPNITAASSGRLTLASPLVTLTCDISFSGSVLSGPITQTGAIHDVGSVTSAAISNCSAGSVRVLIPPTWRIQAVLPLPAGGGANLRIANAGIEVTLGSLVCLYGTTIGATAGDVALSAPSGGRNLLTFTRAPVGRVSGSILCGTATLSGTMDVTPGISITLS